MNEVYKKLLSMTIGLNILSYWTGKHWIGYTIIVIAILGLFSEKLLVHFFKAIDSILSFVFNNLQKLLLAIIFYTVITPISILKRRAETKNNHWVKSSNKDNQQLKKMW